MVSSLRARGRFVRVAVNSGRTSYLTFSYSVPDDLVIGVGSVVHVPFGQRTLQGVVIDGPFDTPGFDREAVRPVESVADGIPPIDPLRMRLAEWIRDYYLSPPWEACALFLPPGAREHPVTEFARVVDGTSVAEPPPDGLPAAVFAVLDAEASPLDQIRARLDPPAATRDVERALAALVRRGLVARSYRLGRPRGRARVIDVVSLAIDPSEARRIAAGIEGRRVSRQTRVLRELLEGQGAVEHESLLRDPRDRRAFGELADAGLVRLDGDRAVLEIDPERAALEARARSWSAADRAAVGLLELLSGDAADGDGAAVATRGAGRSLPVRGLPARVGGGARAALDRLQEAGVVRVEEVLDRRDPLRDLDFLERPPVELVAEQRRAAEFVRAAIDRGAGEGIVLRGVTGSGKTEVYLDALEHAVRTGRRAIVMVPEIALTPQTVRRFAERFPGRVGVLHSGLSLGEAHDEWHAVAGGAYDVVIGSRSALFAPQPDLGLIVIDEAHEWTYKQHDPAPRYDARVAALELARLTGATVVLGSATPEVGQWHAAATGDLQRVDLPRRIRPVLQPDGSVTFWPTEDLPTTEIVDMRRSTALFSVPLLDALGDTIERGDQAILFLNRRGLAGYLLCAQGHSPLCSSCDIAMSLHRDGRLLCHQCGRGRRFRGRCEESACGLPLRELRAGTQRVEEEVAKHFPDARVLRWDRDTARSARAHQQLLDRFSSHEADVLVGTQMVAKGLDLPLVTLVGVVLADYTLREGDFRASERTFQLLTQVGGRAGRAERDGHVIVQTMQPDDPAIEAAASQDLDRFYEEELAWRAAHDYPPFGRVLRLTFSHASAAYAAEESHRLASALRDRAAGLPDVRVDGPTPPQLSRLRGRYRWAILVRGGDPAQLLRDDLEELPPGWAVDVDPFDIN